MKIRTHLIILVLGAVLPILVFSGVMTAIFWREQRSAFEKRFLERVKAMSIALDAEIDGYINVLEILGKSPHLATGNLQMFFQEADRARRDQMAFTNIILLDPKGRELINADHPIGIGMSKTPIPYTTFRAVLRSGETTMSPVFQDHFNGGFFTAIMSPVKHTDTVRYVLVAVISQSTWLGFLSRYPVPSDATMTLLDEDGTIIARTLNNERWMGRPPAPALLHWSRHVSDAAYRSFGLEGQRFYSAHSRSKSSGWTIATGVPQEGVEQILHGSTLTMAGGAFGAVFAAVALALFFGGRIAAPVTALVQSASALPNGATDNSGPASPVMEVNEVRAAIGSAGERLRARESALKESEQRFRTFTINAPAAIFTKDLQGRYTLANPLACEALGRPEGVVGMTDYDLVAAEVADALRNNDHEVITRGRPIEREELVGNRYYLSVKFPLLDAGGGPAGVCGVAVDISDRKQAEKALRESECKLREQARELEQQLIASGRLVSLGEVTASMAHEFNNPLGIVMGFAQDLLSETEPSNPQYQSLKIIDEETKRCQKIIEELLEYARPRNAALGPTNVKVVIEKTLNLVSNHLYKHKIETNTSIEGNLPAINADAQQLEQVLLNLFLNAIDAMRSGGTLSVVAMLEGGNGAPPVMAITVADSGIGIDQKHLGKIFQPFFTAKKGRGLGLGLPICERIIKNHGGNIEVETRPGQGTTFKISIPVEPVLERMADAS